MGRMTGLLAAVGVQEILAVVGLLMLAGGLAMVSIALALIVVGALLLGLAVLPLMTHRGE